MRLEVWAEWLYAVCVVPSALAEHSGLKAKGDDRREENLHWLHMEGDPVAEACALIDAFLANPSPKP